MRRQSNHIRTRSYMRRPIEERMEIEEKKEYRKMLFLLVLAAISAGLALIDLGLSFKKKRKINN